MAEVNDSFWRGTPSEMGCDQAISELGPGLYAGVVWEGGDKPSPLPARKGLLNPLALMGP